MSSPEAVSVVRRASSPAHAPVRVAFVGSDELLDSYTPAAPVYGLRTERFPVFAGQPLDVALERFHPHVTVILDPRSHAAGVDPAAAGTTLGILIDGAGAGALPPLDRLVSFDPALTGERVDEAQEVWRSIPPPVSDAYFADVRALRGAPRAMTLGASGEHREAVLMPAKHHHDLLQLIHGVSGAELVALLGEHDVGIYVSERDGGGFGHEAAVHLAAGQLLLAAAARPAYGLERDIDYLHFSSADELVWMLDRLGRFPEMHHRVHVRGRLKAEQFRASRVFARIVHDLLLDVDAFGAGRRAHASPDPAGRVS